LEMRSTSNIGRAAVKNQAQDARYWYERSVGTGDNWIEVPNADWLVEHASDIADLRTALDRDGEMDISEAERLFLRSIEIGRNQKALSWELRSATSLARLWHHRGRTADARDLLSRAYDRFTQGFETSNLVEAKALLDVLR
jgi:predicted ATPase